MKTKNSSAAWSFGKEKTRQLNRSTALVNPGPGQYEQDNKNKLAAPQWK